MTNITQARNISDVEVAHIVRFYPLQIDGQQARNGAGREIAAAIGAAFATVIRCAPPSGDRSAALRKLREAMADANSAITHNGEY